MKVETEEKILKFLGVFTLLVFVPVNFLVIEDKIRLLYILIPLLIVFTMLYYRKYTRDKKLGRDMSRYKMLLGFLVIAIFLFLLSVICPNL